MFCVRLWCHCTIAGRACKGAIQRHYFILSLSHTHSLLLSSVHFCGPPPKHRHTCILSLFRSDTAKDMLLNLKSKALGMCRRILRLPMRLRGEQRLVGRQRSWATTISWRERYRALYSMCMDVCVHVFVYVCMCKFMNCMNVCESVFVCGGWRRHVYSPFHLV